MAIEIEPMADATAMLVEAMNRLADALCGPRKWHEEPCMDCQRNVGSLCDLDKHAQLDRQRARAAVGH